MNKFKKLFAAVFAVLLALAVVPMLALCEEGSSRDSSSMPDWYPSDPSSWTFTPAGDNAPRVVDDADILTDAEEASIAARIEEVKAQFPIDIVVFTDTSTHGLERRVYAADFYDFCGYGVGEDHSGFCLFVCMDPSSRGFWTCVTGDEPRRLYTQDNSSDLDQVLYGYMSSGNYGNGIYDWVGNIGTLMDKGIPFAPEWYPSLTERNVRRHDPNAPAVVDTANVLTAEQEAQLTKKVNELNEKYNIGLVIHTSSNTYSLTKQDYTDDFYKYNGYGAGDNYDGAILTLFTGSRTAFMQSSGKVSDKLTETNVEQLLEGASGPAGDGDFYKSAERWLKYLDKTLKTGRTPRTPAVWSVRSAIAGAVSLLVSAFRTSSAKNSMKTVRTAYDAGDHLVESSFRMGNSKDEFTHSTQTTVYSPRQRESTGGGGGGGGGGYSGGYSGSSGTSHSGSGMDF